MPIFFTLPPQNIDYPYILINLNSFYEGYRYIKNHFKNIKKVIIDSSIEIFRNPLIKDYPIDIEYKLTRQYRKIRDFISNVWITIPDYCDDYHPRNLWINDKITNIERTVKNVVYYTSKYDFNWLIPIQGWYKDPESVFRCLKHYDILNILDAYNYFGVANLCVEPNIKIIRKTVINVRSILSKKQKIHIFGLKIKALKYISHLIDSFDSMAWTRPVDSSIKKYFIDRKNRSVRATIKINGKEMRKIYFLKYLKTLSRYNVTIL